MQRAAMAAATVHGIEVTGLNSSVTRPMLRTAFEAFGPVEACWLIPKMDGTPTAHVRFQFGASAKAATVACESQNVSVAGVPVKCRLWNCPNEVNSADPSRRVDSRSRSRRKYNKVKKKKERKRHKSSSRSSSTRSRYRGKSGHEKREHKPAHPEPNSPKEVSSSARVQLAQAFPAAVVPNPPAPMRIIDSTTTKQTKILEVRNLPPEGDGAPPHECLVGMLNPTLEILPDFDKAKGKAVCCSWSHAPSVCRMEFQSASLCDSAARIVTGLDFSGHVLTAHVAD